jgi:hypothetical protein
MKHANENKIKNATIINKFEQTNAMLKKHVK